ncbi:MFS transporter [Streptomyces sp. NPDC048172]|uniref:MFS transporter n=1 Tax=Streptomyces sp. NPDC048172 TaxID=3365505 RepID=UPI0037149387
MPSTRTGYLSLFRVGEFRAMFAAHTLSLLGTVVSAVALPVLVYADTDSPFLAALTFALGFLPHAAGGVVLAPLADRFRARRVLVACDLICAGCVLGMLVPGTPVPVLLALRAASAFVQPLFSGVRTASLGAILDGDAFVLGRSLLRLVAQSAQVVGNGLTGFLLLLVPPRGALVITVAGFLGSALILQAGTRLRPALVSPGRDVGARAERGGTLRLLADRRIRALLLLCWVPPAFAVVPEGLAAPYADALGAGPEGVGLLMAAAPVGAVAGELATGTFLGPKTRERLVLPLACCLPLPFLLFAARPALVPALALLALSGTALAYTLGLDRWFYDAVPEERRGRAMTLMTAGLMSSQGLGMALGGLAAEALPPHLALTLTGAAGTVCVLAVARCVRRL